MHSGFGVEYAFKTLRSKESSFFLELHFKAPHDSPEYAPRYESYLSDVAMPEPLSLWSRGEGSIARGVNGELRESDIGTSSIGRRNFRRSYAADWEVDEEPVSDAEAKGKLYNISI